MREYEFTLKFKLQDSSIDLDFYVEKLYEFGCDDAIVGLGKKGYIGFNFIRKSHSAYEAVTSAIRDIKKAIPKANLIEASPDFVGIMDIANLLGCTRQNIQKLISKNNSYCPPAVYTGSQSVWHLVDILDWLVNYKDYNIDESSIEIARVTMYLNTVKRLEKIDYSITENLRNLIAS
jgi:predicted DNA-binding transcriptional regulator AlpA